MWFSAPVMWLLEELRAALVWGTELERVRNRWDVRSRGVEEQGPKGSQHFRGRYGP